MDWQFKFREIFNFDYEPYMIAWKLKRICNLKTCKISNHSCQWIDQKQQRYTIWVYETKRSINIAWNEVNREW